MAKYFVTRRLTMTVLAASGVIFHQNNRAFSSNTVTTDVFMSHDWGENQINHKRVAKINAALQIGDNKLSTWFDEERMTGDARSQMVNGIDNANVVVVFLTKKYMYKINHKDHRDNCNYEFNYAFETKGNKKLVVVVMEAKLLNTLRWHGKFGAAVNGTLYVDMTQDPITDEKINELKQRIHYAMNL